MCGTKELGCELAVIGLATMANEYYHWMTWPMFVGAVLLAYGAYKWFFPAEKKAPAKKAPRKKKRR